MSATWRPSDPHFGFGFSYLAILFLFIASFLGLLSSGFFFWSPALIWRFYTLACVLASAKTPHLVTGDSCELHHRGFSSVRVLLDRMDSWIYAYFIYIHSIHIKIASQFTLSNSAHGNNGSHPWLRKDLGAKIQKEPEIGVIITPSRWAKTQK